MSIGLPTTPALFINEDVSKPENRVNLALFSLMLIEDFRKWLLQKLSLPQNSIIYPPQNMKGFRPDFVVVADDRVVAWIEVELGAENGVQMKSYRSAFNEPVRSIVGSESDHGDVSLEAIAHVLNIEYFQGLDRQQSVSIGIFTKLVNVLKSQSRQFNYTDPNEAIRINPLINQLQNHLGFVLQFGVPPIISGVAQVSTITQKGWTIRVYSKVSKSGSVSLMWNQSNGIRIPSYERLLRCLPSAVDAIDGYRALLQSLGVDIRTISEAQSLLINESLLLSNIVQLAACIRMLAVVHGATPVFGVTSGAINI